MSPNFYRPRHAAPFDAAQARRANDRADGYQPRHADDLVRTVFTGHGIGHHDYPADIRFGGVA